MASIPRTYSSSPDFVPEAGFLTDGAMREVLDCRPIVCVDILLVDRTTKELLLPTRTLASGRGLWFIGGMLKRNQTFEQAGAAALQREAGLEIDESRLSFLAVNRFVWDVRNETPQQNGRVDINFCYTLEPTPEEITTIHSSLTSSEYDNTGLLRLNRMALAAALETENPAKKVLLDYYDTVFAN